MSDASKFFDLYRQGFVRTAVAVPEVRVADPEFNAAETARLMGAASEKGACVVAFPELGLTGYSCDDLFHQQALLGKAVEALRALLAVSQDHAMLAVVGMPIEIEGSLLNCAVALCRGRILGVVPKTYLPNYREFYELRHFASGDACRRSSIDLCEQRDVPFGSTLIFAAADVARLKLHVEICEDLWAPIAPSTFGALAGAFVLLNLSASNVVVGKDDYRRLLGASQSARCLAAYLYCASGFGESTTDLAWDGHGFIYENGSLLAETERFRYRSQLAFADLDLDRLVQDRIRQNTFAQAAQRHRDAIDSFRTIDFTLDRPARSVVKLERCYDRFPYVPADLRSRDLRCEEIYEIQVQGLVKRLRSMQARKLVIGVSGGLDSTHALLVCARAMDVLELPRSDILAYTMPGFATSRRTLDQAHRLMRAVGATAREIDIRPSCLQMLKDLDHPYSRGERVFDVTFENVQAGERTSHLFRLANQHNAPVVGTSDLSELALGWSTYGVGDHMAHYHVNASIPKTLIQYLVRWVAARGELGADASAVLNDIVDTEISPELVPGDAANQPAQRSESVVGPYELQDFILYYVLRFGYAPPKVAYLAYSAWSDRDRGRWPDVPEGKRNQYSLDQIRHWLDVFLLRFFQLSQYKRSCIANAPKVGSGGSLSPRGDWRAPSDGEAAAWRSTLAQIPSETN
ncbi:MAG: NAD(+) synthase [Burkholderiales bacterium]|nr:NAD(+) synthase [Burkholderiales bacterium]